MIINHNLSAMNAHRQLGANQTAGAKAQEKLSSGLRINRAGDDAAGLAISEKMRAQVRGLDQASRNAQDGISLIQTAEGALNETHSILQRMRELATQASNDTNTATDRNELQKEMNELIDEIDRIAGNTEFNTKNLTGAKDEQGEFTGADQSFTFHIGANSSQNITLSIGSMDAARLGEKEDGALTDNTIKSLRSSVSEGSEAVDPVLDGDGNVTTPGVPAVEAGPVAGALETQAGADAAITTIQAAIDQVSAERSKLGANQNRLEHTISNLDNASENMQAAESRIRDVDMAKEIMEFTKNNILSQASQSMLAQANQAPQQVLQLLG